MTTKKRKDHAKTNKPISENKYIIPDGIIKNTVTIIE